MPWPGTREFLDALRRLLTVHPLTLATHETPLALAARYGLAIYDAMIVGAAADAGCDTLWSEDMHDGQVIENGLRIVKPFRAA